MKLTCILASVMMLVACSTVSAMPGLFDVWGVGSSDALLGTISAYEGNIDAATNYNYSSASGHPINGPTPAGYKAFIWMYWDNSAAAGDRLSFNMIHDVDGGGSPNNIVHWDMNFTGTSYNVLLQDDAGEGGGFTDLGGGAMTADFHYWYNTDGGVIGVDEPACGSCWEIYLAPELLGDIRMLKAASGDGNDVMMWNTNTDFDAFKITPHCPIPEPTTMLLLGTGLMLGAGWMRRKK